MNLGVLTEELPLDPATTINSRPPHQTFSWVKKLFLSIKKSSLNSKIKKIYIHLLFCSIKKLIFLLVIFPSRILIARFLANNSKKTDKHKNRIFQYISRKLRMWKQKAEQKEGAILTSNTLSAGF
jgi:hypothetical protein